jgi:hypothetical protein
MKVEVHRQPVACHEEAGGDEDVDVEVDLVDY